MIETKVPNEQLLSVEITQNPGNLESVEFSQALMAQFRQSVLSFLGIENVKAKRIGKERKRRKGEKSRGEASRGGERGRGDRR